MSADWKTRSISVAFAISFLLVVFAIFESWTAAQATRRQADWTLHTAIVLGKSEQVARNAIDAGVGVRRYVFTNHSHEYLLLFDKSKRELASNIAALDILTRSNPMQQRRLSKLKTHAQSVMVELETILAVSRSGDRQRARNIIEVDAGKPNMDLLRASIVDIQAAEQHQFLQRSKNTAAAYQNQKIYILAALAGALLLGTLTLILIIRHIAALRREQVELGNFNRELEDRVETRTHELLASTTELEKKHSEAEFERSRVEVLLRELNHRIGNNLAMVSAFLGLESSNSKNVEVRAIIDRARSRIQAIALAQRRLRLEEDYASADLRATLTAVIQDLLEYSIQNTAVDLQINIEQLSIDARDVTSLAVILNELVTNALKSAFAGRGEGTIHIDLIQKAPGVCLTVKDDGAGFDINILKHKGQGLGGTIIDRMARQYGGTAHWTSGTMIVVNLPKMVVRPRTLN
jgi:two-component sensor histidine kinase